MPLHKEACGRQPGECHTYISRTNNPCWLFLLVLVFLPPAVTLPDPSQGGRERRFQVRYKFYTMTRRDAEAYMQRLAAATTSRVVDSAAAAPGAAGNNNNNETTCVLRRLRFRNASFRRPL